MKNVNVRILLLLLPFFIISCGGGSDSPLSTSGAGRVFSNPQQVSIQGYSGDIMEPFISRDGRYLFFNDNGANKDIYFASYDTLTDVFTFQGRIDSIASNAVEGVPTLDVNNRFYYISTFNYPPGGAAILDTIYVGDFDPANPAIITNPTVVPNLAEGIPGHLNFDTEVSADGTTLYSVDGIFSGNPFPDTANFFYAIDKGTGFVRATDSDVIFANINTTDLEYAAGISQDELEFFFTRLVWLDPSTPETTIYRATRPDKTSAFGVPQSLSAIKGFVEAPTLSADEKTLYYHRKNPTSGTFELYRVTRS